MSAHETGGPAFPELDSSSEDSDGRTRYHSDGGLSVRDYFAAKALSGIASTVDVNGTVYWKEVAADAYAAADAMLAERAK